MNRNLGIILLFCLLAFLIIIPLHLASVADRARLESELAASKQAGREMVASLNASSGTVAQLEQKLGEMSTMLTATADQLQLMAGQSQKGPVAGAAQVKAVGGDGQAGLGMEFDRIDGADGVLLATNATFSGLYGRRLVFRSPGMAPLGFDVEQVHPEVLAKLDVNADLARRRQYEMDEEKRSQAEAVRKAYQLRLAAERKYAEQMEAVRREQDRLAREQQKEAQERALALDQLAVERQKAEAALTAATAAMIRAQNPTPVYVYGAGVTLPMPVSNESTLPTPPTPGTPPVAATPPVMPSQPARPVPPTPPTKPTGPPPGLLKTKTP